MLKNSGKDWKNALESIIFQTEENSNQAQNQQPEKRQAEIPQKQVLRIELDKRRGKPATIVSGFNGTNEQLKALAKTLKIQCGAGGSFRDGEILVQGDFRTKIVELLIKMDCKVIKIGF